MTSRCHFCEAQKGALHFAPCTHDGIVQLHQCGPQISAIERRTPLERRATARLDEFDKQAAVITLIRGGDYGPPRQDFERAQRIFQAILGDENPANVDPAVRHVFYMLAVKLARLRLTPTHLDSWIDIAGYARCGVNVTDDLLPGGSRYGQGGRALT